MTFCLPLTLQRLRRLTAALLSLLIVMVTVPCTMAAPLAADAPAQAMDETCPGHAGTPDTQHKHHQPVCNLCCIICHAAAGADPPQATAPSLAVLVTLTPAEARAALAAARPSPFEARGPPIRL